MKRDTCPRSTPYANRITLISYQRSRCSRKTGLALAKAGIAGFYLEQRGTGGRGEGRGGEARSFGGRPATSANFIAILRFHLKGSLFLQKRSHCRRTAPDASQVARSSVTHGASVWRHHTAGSAGHDMNTHQQRRSSRQTDSDREGGSRASSLQSSQNLKGSTLDTVSGGKVNASVTSVHGRNNKHLSKRKLPL